MADNVGFEPTVGCPTLSFQDSGLNRSPNCLYKKSMLYYNSPVINIDTYKVKSLVILP